MDIAIAVSLERRAAARHVLGNVELHRGLAHIGRVETLHGHDIPVLIDDVDLRHPVHGAVLRRDHRVDRLTALHADEDSALDALERDVRRVLLPVDLREHRLAVEVRGLLPEEVGVDGLPGRGRPLLRSAGRVGRARFRSDYRRDRDGLADPQAVFVAVTFETKASHEFSK